VKDCACAEIHLCVAGHNRQSHGPLLNLRLRPCAFCRRKRKLPCVAKFCAGRIRTGCRKHLLAFVGLANPIDSQEAIPDLIVSHTPQRKLFSNTMLNFAMAGYDSGLLWDTTWHILLGTSRLPISANCFPIATNPVQSPNDLNAPASTGLQFVQSLSRLAARF